MKPKQTRDKAWYTRSKYKRALGNSSKLMSKHPFDKTMRNKYVHNRAAYRKAFRQAEEDFRQNRWRE